MEGHGGADDPVQVIFDLADFVGLTLDGEILVDYADAAETGHRDRHVALGNRIHRRADERNIEFDVPRKFAGNIRVVRQEVRILSHQRNVVECQSLERERGHELIDVAHDRSSSISKLNEILLCNIHLVKSDFN